MATDISKLGLKTKWQELTGGMIVAGAGTSRDFNTGEWSSNCLLYTSPSPRDISGSRMPSSA